MELPFLLQHGLPHFILKGALGRQFVLQPAVEHADARCPLLGRQKRQIGTEHQLLARAGVQRCKGKADAGGQSQLVPPDREIGFEGMRERGGDRWHLYRIGAVRHERGEFVAADPGQHGVVAKTRLQANRDEAKQIVANQMTERVVDAFEAVEIEHQDGDRPGFECLIEPFAKGATVRKSGKRIMTGEVPEFGVARVAGGDVLDLRAKLSAVRRLPRR